MLYTQINTWISVVLILPWNLQQPACLHVVKGAQLGFYSFVLTEEVYQDLILIIWSPTFPTFCFLVTEAEYQLLVFTPGEVCECSYPFILESSL